MRRQHEILSLWCLRLSGGVWRVQLLLIFGQKDVACSVLLPMALHRPRGCAGIGAARTAQREGALAAQAALRSGSLSVTVGRPRLSLCRVVSMCSSQGSAVPLHPGCPRTCQQPRLSAFASNRPTTSARSLPRVCEGPGPPPAQPPTPWPFRRAWEEGVKGVGSEFWDSS
ncbi:hypothetical protein HJG60_008831 [Phyllostomus discolor]|uniref:Uncharacterized protein n=1 Tax=Phyllostomus discolor TaxID=89673 RepID=A0A833YWK5_9CHIR|nr:hypothetical protein HJG60_008831 [Phyllostomus discolor]